MRHMDTDDIVVPYTMKDARRLQSIEVRVGMLMWMGGILTALLTAGLGWLVMHG